ncbi:type II toxin-antitoxin system death-on-curing family toxin [Nonomuraea turcica]|uniref:type II toxin-antitoxin system death-on-curing family toxin n=1 Tax=Nonomuraea sp. G32 TaxID=3067274 RepID=UPI00273A7A97|nr:type II toxin-antitoxin system death-on-curing family toxin [Nonomuraea sp. G32]MDP4509181.1 type II toxin-antitoxin system death-on-curing family toxin [Nonomuraea sp. G32]
MTRYVTLEQGLRVARAAVGGPIEVRDLGLLEAALLRPQTSLFGRDAYPDLFEKGAALLHSVVANHPFVDGNKRADWLLTYVFLAKNGVELDPADDDVAYDLVIAVASGKLTEVDEIADVLRTFTQPS